MSALTPTTTANRVKRAGYWCADADKQTQALLDAVGADWDTEIPIAAGLDHLGLANTLLGLGAPRPRFKRVCDKIISEYVDRLLWHLHIASEESGIYPRKAPKEFVEEWGRIIKFDKYSAVRSKHRRDYQQLKFEVPTPQQRCVCEAMLILLDSDAPLYMRALHAGKELLSAAEIIYPGNHLLDELKKFLREKLDAASAGNI